MTLLPIASSFHTGNCSTAQVVPDLSLVGEKWDSEILFHSLWIPSFSKLFVFATAGDAGGFDQLLWIDPATGAAHAQLGNLAEDSFFFQVQDSTHTNDLLQCACYDPINNYIYFQTTQSQGSDDTDADTVIANVYLDHLDYPPNVQVRDSLLD